MKIGVTGGAGRIGTQLVAKLQGAHDVVVIDSVEGTEVEGAEFRSADITSFEQTVEATRGLDAVVHLAAIPWDLPDDAPKVAEVNILGTHHLLEAAHRNDVQRVVIASSICATGFMFRLSPLIPDYFPVDERHPIVPGNMYGLSKAANELAASMYANRYGMSTFCLRFAPVWFEQMNPFTIWSLAGAYQPEIGRDSIWAYIGAPDVVQAIGLSLETQLSGHRVYNVGAATACSLESSEDLVKRFYPESDAGALRDLTSADPHASLWDIRRVVDELGYAPTVAWQQLAEKLPQNVVDVATHGTLDDLREEVYGTRGTRPMG